MSNTSQMSTRTYSLRTYSFTNCLAVGDYPPSIYPKKYKLLGWSLIFIAFLLFIGLSMTTPLETQPSPSIASGVSATR